MVSIMARRALRFLAQVGRNRSGVAAAEFALVLPLLAMGLFGLSQVGFLYFTYNAMLNGARTGAREIVFGRSEAAVTAAVRSQLPPWAAATAAITLTPNDDGVARVRISVPGADASLLQIVPMPETIDAEVAMPRVGDR